MAFINRESDYAIRILRAICDEKIHSMEEICATQFMGKAFAYKIAKKLEKDGTIQIIRGKHGGIKLKRDLSHYSLYDLMEVVENNKHMNECFRSGFKCEYADNVGCCNIKNNLVEFQRKIDRELKSCKISDLF